MTIEPSGIAQKATALAASTEFADDGTGDGSEYFARVGSTARYLTGRTNSGLFVGIVDDPHFSLTAYRKGRYEFIVQGWWVQKGGLPVLGTLSIRLQRQPSGGGWLNLGAPSVRSNVPSGGGAVRKVTARARCAPNSTATLRGVLDIDIQGASDDSGKDYSRIVTVKCSPR